MNLSGRTVLVVEDESIIAMALEDMLYMAGATAVPAGTLAQAEALLAAQDFDAAVLDVNVFGQSSYPFAAQLVARAIPFIFATGYGKSLHPPELLSVPTVSKPYNVGDIVGAFAALG